MSPQMAGLQLALLAFVLFALVASAITSLLARRALHHVPSLPPAVAVGRLRWLLAAPLGAAALMTLVAFLPSVAASVVDVHHHCTSHDGHPHLCFVHLPVGHGPVAGWVVLGAAVLITAARLAPVVADLRRSDRLLRALPPLSTAGGVLTLASDEPLCAAVGLWNPTVVVSRAFVDGLGGEALRAAIAHERAHARRKDTLWALSMRMLSVAHAPATARRLLAELDLTTERACDEEAAVEVGDRLVVADAILRAQRLGLRRWGAMAAAFGPGHWAARVDALLKPVGARPTGLRRWDVLAALGTAVLVAGAGPLHHAAETALALIAH